MKTSELRIGNYLYWDYMPDNVRVTSIDTMQVSHDRSERAMIDIDDLDPIPLTEEWLLKFGFECWGLKKPNQYEHETTYALFNSIEGTSTFMVVFNESWYGGSAVKEWLIRIDHDTIYVYEMEYVHQLQNLYSSLTGNELTIKE